MEISRVTAAVFIALCCVQFTSANVVDYCSYQDDGNYMIYNGTTPVVCSCFGKVQCPEGQWFDPELGACSWSRGLLIRLINCLQSPAVYVESYDVINGDYCKSHYEGGNFPCAPGDSPTVCACCEGMLCQDGHWYNPVSHRCSALTEQMITLMITCIGSKKTTEAPITTTAGIYVESTTTMGRYVEPTETTTEGRYVEPTTTTKY
jgi:hypothetical protein